MLESQLNKVYEEARERREAVPELHFGIITSQQNSMLEKVETSRSTDKTELQVHWQCEEKSKCSGD